jgi:hypothetical protein
MCTDLKLTISQHGRNDWLRDWFGNVHMPERVSLSVYKTLPKRLPSSSHHHFVGGVQQGLHLGVTVQIESVILDPQYRKMKIS